MATRIEKLELLIEKLIFELSIAGSLSVKVARGLELELEEIKGTPIAHLALESSREA